MSMIRPVSDLRNNFAEISRTVHETREPVILTKNGYGDMVVMSYEEYENVQYDFALMRALRTAEIESRTTAERHSADDVVERLREKVKAVSAAHV